MRKSILTVIGIITMLSISSCGGKENDEKATATLAEETTIEAATREETAASEKTTVSEEAAITSQTYRSLNRETYVEPP